MPYFTMIKIDRKWAFRCSQQPACKARWRFLAFCWFCLSLMNVISGSALGNKNITQFKHSVNLVVAAQLCEFQSNLKDQVRLSKHHKDQHLLHRSYLAQVSISERRLLLEFLPKTCSKLLQKSNIRQPKNKERFKTYISKESLADQKKILDLSEGPVSKDPANFKTHRHFRNAVRERRYSKALELIFPYTHKNRAYRWLYKQTQRAYHRGEKGAGGVSLRIP